MYLQSANKISYSACSTNNLKFTRLVTAQLFYFSVANRKLVINDFCELRLFLICQVAWGSTIIQRYERIPVLKVSSLKEHIPIETLG